MPEEDVEARKGNTISTLWRNQPAELMRNNIANLNGKEIESDYHEGKGNLEDYSKYPKEFFTMNLSFKDKIDLILKYQEITIEELAIAIKISKDELLEYYNQNKIPKNDILMELSNISSYPVSFFKRKSMIESTKSNHKKKIILSIVLISIFVIIVAGGFIYFGFIFKR